MINRIVITGSESSGKTTLAKHLSKVDYQAKRIFLLSCDDKIQYSDIDYLNKFELKPVIQGNEIVGYRCYKRSSFLKASKFICYSWN